MSVSTKAIKTILIIAGVLSSFYGCIVLLLVSSNHWFNFAGFIVGAILILDGIFFDRLKELNKKTPKALRMVICILIAVCMIFFFAFEGMLIKFATCTPEDNADWMIVLGAKVNGQTPSLEFQRRIEKALEYAKNNPSTKIVLTGGKGNDEDIPESLAAYNYLKDNGISEDRLFREEKSTSTKENFLYAKEIIEASGHMSDSVVVVSSSFHLYRASMIVKSFDFTSVSFLGSVGRTILLPHYAIREFAAFVREG